MEQKTNEEIMNGSVKHPDPNHCHKYNAARWKALNPDRRQAAVDFVKKHVAEDVLLDVKTKIEKDREYWWVPYHMVWGMNFRNFLRQNGFGELNFGVTNLDDYYLPILEIAVMGDTWYDDVSQG